MEMRTFKIVGNLKLAPKEGRMNDLLNNVLEDWDSGVGITKSPLRWYKTKWQHFMQKHKHIIIVEDKVFFQERKNRYMRVWR